MTRDKVPRAAVLLMTLAGVGSATAQDLTGRWVGIARSGATGAESVWTELNVWRGPDGQWTGRASYSAPNPRQELCATRLRWAEQITPTIAALLEDGCGNAYIEIERFGDSLQIDRDQVGSPAWVSGLLSYGGPPDPGGGAAEPASGGEADLSTVRAIPASAWRVLQARAGDTAAVAAAGSDGAFQAAWFRLRRATAFTTDGVQADEGFTRMHLDCPGRRARAVRRLLLLSGRVVAAGPAPRAEWAGEADPQARRFLDTLCAPGPAR